MQSNLGTARQRRYGASCMSRCRISSERIGISLFAHRTQSRYTRALYDCDEPVIYRSSLEAKRPRLIHARSSSAWSSRNPMMFVARQGGANAKRHSHRTTMLARTSPVAAAGAAARDDALAAVSAPRRRALPALLLLLRVPSPSPTVRCPSWALVKSDGMPEPTVPVLGRSFLCFLRLQQNPR